MASFPFSIAAFPNVRRLSCISATQSEQTLGRGAEVPRDRKALTLAMKSDYANLDVLRSFAVLSVVAAHLWQQGIKFDLWADRPGVDLLLHNLSFTGVMFFFVHTCLVLMLSMHRAPSNHLGRSFLIRRAFRIYPLCWTVIALALLTGLSDEPGGAFHVLGWRGVVVNLLLVQNVWRGYSNVIGPLWSLDWEAQMYLLLPLFYVVLRRYDRLRVVFLLWSGATLLALACTQPSLPRFLHAAVFPPFFIGGMVAYRLLIRQLTAPPRFTMPAWSWPLFVLSLFAFESWFMGARSFESSQGAGIEACICLILALAIPSFRELRSGWMIRPAEQVAKYSYGIYLLHVPALIFVLRFLPALSLAAKAAVFLLLTSLLSFVCFHAIEAPLIRMGKRLAQSSWKGRATDPDCVDGSRHASRSLCNVGVAAAADGEI